LKRQATQSPFLREMVEALLYKIEHSRQIVNEANFLSWPDLV